MSRRNDSEWPVPERISRRGMLTGATAVALGLAGCGGDGGDTPTEDDTPTDDGGGDASTPTATPTAASEGEPKEDTFVVIGGGGSGQTDPTYTDMQFNEFGGSNSMTHPIDNSLHPVLAVLDSDRNRVDVVAESISVPDDPSKGDKISVTIREGLNWHNGETVTAQDYADHIILQQKILGGWSDYEPPEVLSETEFEATLTRPLARQTIELTAYATQGHGGSPLFDDFIERVKDASSDEKFNELGTELTTEITFDEPIGHGPWQYNEATDTLLKMERFEDTSYPFVPNFPNLHFASFSTPDQAFKNNRLDMLHGNVASSSVLDQSIWPNDQVKVRSVKFSKGNAMALNMHAGTGARAGENMANPRVRQAIAHAVNRYRMALDAAPQPLSQSQKREFAKTNVARDVSNLTAAQQDFWVGEDRASNYPTYNRAVEQSEHEAHLEEATRILRDEGFTKNNGKWFRPDGERFGISHHVPQLAPRHESYVNQLQAFGIKASAQVLEGGEFWSEAIGEEGDKDSSHHEWGTWRGIAPVHPYNNYWFATHSYIGGGTRIELALGTGEEFQSPDNEIVAEVPSEVGTMDSSMKEMNITQKVLELQTTSEREAIGDLSYELGWAFSYLVPLIPHHLIFFRHAVTTDNWRYFKLPEQTGHGTVLSRNWHMNGIKAKLE